MAVLPLPATLCIKKKCCQHFFMLFFYDVEKWRSFSLLVQSLCQRLNSFVAILCLFSKKNFLNIFFKLCSSPPCINLIQNIDHKSTLNSHNFIKQKQRDEVLHKMPGFQIFSWFFKILFKSLIMKNFKIFAFISFSIWTVGLVNLVSLLISWSI